MSKIGGEDVANLPAFFQVNRSSMITVLDHLDALEDEGDALEGDALEDDGDAIPFDNGVEEEFTNDDFDSLTNAGLPQEFSNESFSGSNLEIIGNSMKILNYYDVIGKSNNSVADISASLSQTLGLDNNSNNEVAPAVVVAKENVGPNVDPLKPFPAFVPCMSLQDTTPPFPMLPIAPPVPIAQPITFAKVHNLTDVKPAKYMSRYDMKFVISRILQPLTTEDPFAEDYYYIQSQVKKNNKTKKDVLNSIEESLKANQPLPVNTLPSELIVPLPTWKETKEKIKHQLVSTRMTILQKSKEWQQKEQSLGVTNRSNVRNPKKLLALDSVKDIWHDVAAEDGAVPAAGSGSGNADELTMPFQSKLWGVRLAIQRGYDALYTVQELDQLIKYNQDSLQYKEQAFHQHMMMLSNQQHSFAMAVHNQEGMMKNQEEMHRSQLQFAQESKAFHDMLGEVGRERENALNNLALACGISVENGVTVLNEVLFNSIVGTLKGKKFLSCCLSLFTPEHRWCIFPSLLNKILQVIDSPSVNPAEGTNWTVAQEREVEVKILGSYLEFVERAHKFQQQQEAHHTQYWFQYQQACYNMHSSNIPPPPSMIAKFTIDLLTNINTCLTSIMSINSGSIRGNNDTTATTLVKLRLSLLSNRNRSELLHAMIVIADNVQELYNTRQYSDKTLTEWLNIRDKFMNMLDQE